MNTCRWCGCEFASRNQVFKHVRASSACALAAEQEDARAPAVLAEVFGPKTHAAVFVMKKYAVSEEAVVLCLTQSLEAAGAQHVAVQRAREETEQPMLRDGASIVNLVARFSCSCSSHTKRCGDELLHRMYTTLSQCSIDSDVAGDFHLLFSSMIPGAHKASIEELCSQDHSPLLPASIALQGHISETDAMAQIMSADLSGVITVIVTTSPMRSDPDLDILETTFGSLHLAGLHICRKILVCDSLNVDTTTFHGPDHAPSDLSTPETKFRGFKKGFLPLEYIERYRARLQALRAAQWVRDAKIELLELQAWHGFALATRCALKEVRTPLVCVIQHDLAFLRRVDLAPIAALLVQKPASAVRSANFVNFPRVLQHKYRDNLLRKNGLEVGPPVVFHTPCGAVSLTRLPQFLDGTHLARVDWYLGVFKRAEHDEVLRPMASVGSFQELTLGKYMFKIARNHSDRVSVIGGGVVGAAAAACAVTALKRRCTAEWYRGQGKGGSAHQTALVSRSVLTVCAEFGGWMWNTEDPAGYLIFHLNSAGHYARWERDKNALPASPFLALYHEKVAAQAMQAAAPTTEEAES